MNWNDRNRIEKCFAPLELPFTIAFRTTIPLMEERTWNRIFSSICVVIAPQVLIVAFKLSGSRPAGLSFHIWWLIFGPILAGIAYWRTTDKLPFGVLRVAFISLSFTMAFIWPFLIANELVDLLGLFGLIANISGGILGVTVLAIGNSLQVFFSLFWPCDCSFFVIFLLSCHCH